MVIFRGFEFNQFSGARIEPWLAMHCCSETAIALTSYEVIWRKCGKKLLLTIWLLKDKKTTSTISSGESFSISEISGNSTNWNQWDD